MTLGSHQTAIGKSQDHITPQWLLARLGPFDLDPAAADPRPWDCARVSWTKADDGLSRPWPREQRIFLNPPYDRRVVGEFIRRLAEHGDGLGLLHARTECDWFKPLWRSASAILFLAKRIKYCRADGSAHPFNSGAPPVLAAFGERNAAVLATCGLAGVLVRNWKVLAKAVPKNITTASLRVRSDHSEAAVD
jgi:hypothetical protein